MVKNYKFKNIFESYLNDIILNEAVKPVEDNTPQRALTPEEDKVREQKGWSVAQARIMFDRANEIKANQTPYAQSVNKAAAAQPTTQPTTTQPATTQPTTQPVVSNNQSDDEGWSEVGEPEIQNVTNQYKTASTGSNAYTKPAGQINQTPKPTNQYNNQTSNPAQVTSSAVIGSRPSNSAGKYNFGGTTITSTPVAASDDEFEQNDEDKEDWTEVGEPEVENITYQKNTGTTITSTPVAASDDEFKKKGVKLEKINISKFLKHISEKNYSSAHKYLKAILNSKINNNVLERIEKKIK